MTRTDIKLWPSEYSITDAICSWAYNVLEEINMQMLLNCYLAAFQTMHRLHKREA